MQLLQAAENVGVKIPSVSALSEGGNPSYETCIRLAYRAQRALIEENVPTSNMAKMAARQAKALLHMAPQVQKADMPGVKALAIKNWNYEFGRLLQELLVKEASLEDEITSAMSTLVPSEILMRETDEAKISQVLGLARMQQQKTIKTVNGIVRILHYTFRGSNYIAVERPNVPTQLFRGVKDDDE